ncbi:MAG TPA: haloacid dehalogenase-like hydrolase [Spirochaetota bacterium]|nr:haloacid dehalogenase-like hydrolase [Spirochaetota bacterium]
MPPHEVPLFSRAVFCDFDGTVTSEESFLGMFRRFAPEVYREVGPEMHALRLTIREGVRRIVDSIPSALYAEILEYVRTIPIRPGFTELLDYLDKVRVPFVIISGGLRGMVESRLGELSARVHAVHAPDVDISGERLRVFSDFERGGELMAKADVIARYAPVESVCIGDGPTDLTMAQAADLVFARDGLARFLDHINKPYFVWSDFHDVRAALEERWE